MIPPINKFVLVLSRAIDELCATLEDTLPPAAREDVLDIVDALRDATNDFKATGGAE